MPFYEVRHTLPLSESQQTQLAEAITHIHSRLFITPSLFVNVIFTDNTQKPIYVAGKQRKTNLIMLNSRPGGGRTKEQYEQLCKKLDDAWKAAVAGANGNAGELANFVPTKENKLGGIFVLGSIIAGYEGGFMIPDAGDDQRWFKEKLPEMKAAAANGDEAMAEMLAEIATREDFQSVLNGGA